MISNYTHVYSFTDPELTATTHGSLISFVSVMVSNAFTAFVIPDAIYFSWDLLDFAFVGFALVIGGNVIGRDTA